MNFARVAPYSATLQRFSTTKGSYVRLNYTRDLGFNVRHPIGRWYLIQGGSGDLIIVITCVHRPRSFSHVGEVSFSPITHAAERFFFEGQSLQRYEGRFLYCKIQFPLVKIMSQDTAMVGARWPATGISTALQIRSLLHSPLRYTAPYLFVMNDYQLI